MKLLYETPDAEYVELMVQDKLLNAGLGFSTSVEEDEEEGFG